ncbi:ParB/RepB/Spo0J family partition protein [Lysobacter enzymogenes]|uniref:ParB/RepB/Spo0J family partition protein n=1 Tax=Lysobacter enzymogenes TaxID=69 RepID=UPI001117407A|nr:ParB N-terminal domain-containing protein [Lysobacter enzymogenes]UZW61825.1 ParB N-terminal domain-containing protein [Lysobacter enzymogenes]
MNLEYHELCLMLPDMNGEAFSALVEDIRQHGQRREIVLYEGRILDGRHRYRACIECGVKPRTVEFDGKDPVAFVVSENVARRHLSESQRGMVAAKLANLEVGRPGKSANLHLFGVKLEQAADLLAVSRRMVAKASDVKKNGSPSLVQQVEAGKISMNEAEKIASLGPKSQDRIAKIEDKRARKNELAKALNISQGRKNPSPRTDFIEPKEQCGWVSTFMARFESLVLVLTEAGVEPETLSSRLVDEVNWSDRRFNVRFGSAHPWFHALGNLPDRTSEGRRSA